MVEKGAVARAAGLAYLSTIIFGLFAELYVRTSIRGGDAAATAERLQALEELYRLGILADALMLVSYVVVTALLYRLFKPVSATVSLLAALFSMVGIAILAASLSLLVAPLAADPALAGPALRLHGAAYNLTGLFFGPYCILIGWLVVRSSWVPAWIGVLLMAAGIAFVIDGALELAWPALARQIPDAVMAISLVGEGALAIWLALLGGRGAPAPAGNRKG